MGPNSFDFKLAQQETIKRKVVQIFVDPKRARSKMNHFSLACLLLNKLAGSKLFGSTCNLLVSCETTREVVHIFFERASLLKLVGSKHILNHFENLGRPVVQQACWVNIVVGSHVVQKTVLTRQALTCLPGQKLVEPC